MNKYVVPAAIAFLIVLGLFLGIFVSKDQGKWVCEDGEWVKRGNPKGEKPTTGCELPQKTEDLISSSLPQGVFVRDVQKIPDKDESYLVLYVEEGYSENSWEYSCPGLILGNSIIGKYHLAYLVNRVVVNDLLIPPVYDGGVVELTYKNYKESWPEEGEEKQMEVIKLLDLVDINGDGLAYEFMLITTAGGCGFYDGMVGGYDPTTNMAVLYSDWIFRFDPDENGKSLTIFDCGDHGNTTKVETYYEFDRSKRKFVKISETETPCEI